MIEMGEQRESKHRLFDDLRFLCQYENRLFNTNP